MTLAERLRRFLVSQRQHHLKPKVEFVIPSLNTVGFDDFLKLQMPEREWLLEPILPEKSLNMIFASRGIGKSWLAISVGLAVASGSCQLLRWQAKKPRRVLYVDGEMVLEALQSRLRCISDGLGVVIPNDGFRILAADNTKNGINISTEEGRAALTSLLDGIDLVVFDNISTLTNNSESSADSWGQLQSWLLRLRRSGTSALLIHHSGKSGLTQRGTSKREDALDTIISLRRPGEYLPEHGCKFEVHYTKLRNKTSENDATPFEASYNDGQWVAKNLKPPMLQQATELFQNGLSIRQVAARLSIPKSTAWRLRELSGITADYAETERAMN